MLERRTLLHGLVALPAAALPAGAAILGASLADPALAELAQTYARTWDRLQTTMTAFNAAEGRLVRPAVPEALFVQDGEQISDAVQSRRNGRWCYDRKVTIEAMRAWKPEWSDKPAWLSSWARRDEIVGAFDAWQAAVKVAEDAAGFTVANADFEAALKADDAVRLRIINYQSTDPACLQLKLRAFKDSLGHGDIADAINCGVEQYGPSESELALSMARDLCAAQGVRA